MKLTLSQIRLDGGTQSRAALNEQALADYAEAMGDGEQFPPVVVFHDGEAYWLADGFHRVRAAERACIPEIDADVRQGSQRDAVLYSVGANSKNGVPRSPADKRRAVLRLLEDAEWSAWSDREIARQAAVSHEFVRRERAKSSVNVDRCEPRKVERGGVVYEMQTANIGAKKAAPAPTEPAPIRESVDTDSRIAAKPSAFDADERARLVREAEKGQRMLRGEATEEDEEEDFDADRAREFVDRVSRAVDLPNPQNACALVRCALACLKADDREAEKLGRTFEDQLVKYRAG